MRPIQVRFFVRAAVLLCLLIAHTTLTLAQYTYSFQNPNLPVEERISNLLSLMTVEEKIACLSTKPDIPRLGVSGTGHVEGLHGLAMGGPGGWGRPSVVPTTQFPQAVGLGETWDPALLRRVAAVEATETRYMVHSSRHQAGLVVRAPNADLARDIRWGRTEESYGEDAFHAGTMVVSFVKGLQGENGRYWQTASLLKHFLANSNEDGRGNSSSNFDERLFREYYSVPFRMGIMDGGARAFMAAYNAYNGIPMTVHPALKAVTVREWGNDGIICTDAGALTNLVTLFRRYPNLEQGAADSIKAGINQFLDKYEEPTQTGHQQKLITEADLDEALRGVFRVMIRLGQLDPPSMVPYRNVSESQDPWDSEEHKELARLATVESIVLLKNAGKTLPLNARSLKSVAVLGPYADQVLLDWYSGTPPYAVSPLQGIKNKVGTRTKVLFAKDNEGGAAVKNAAQSEVAIVVVGNHPECDAGWAKCPLPSDGKEAVDRKSITLEQEELVKQVYAVNPRTVVVLIASFPYAINWTQANIPAILKLSHNSQEEGNALADVLFGDFNPGGRLVHTWPKSLDQLPPIMDYDLRHGRTYMYFNGKPLYPFGYGLSYTTFEYSNLDVRLETTGNASAPVLQLDVKNTGDRVGDEVVQVYASYPHSRVSRPKKQLVAFQRIRLAAGEKRRVTLHVRPESIAYWDVTSKKFVVEDGTFNIAIGGSSADVRLAQMVTISKSEH
jgi:beta-glucosidase